MSGAGPLVGAWCRAGLIVGGQRVKDRCEVLWLQSEDWYADIRVPAPDAGEASGPESLFARPWAFGGRGRWEPPVMTWEHLLDSDPDPDTDSNRLVLDGDLAFEEGQIEWHGAAVPFCEEWQRISPPDAEVSTEVNANRIDIVLARWRITMLDERPYGPFRATRHERGASGWKPAGQVHAPAE